MSIFTRIAWDASLGLIFPCSVFIFLIIISGPSDPSCRSSLFPAWRQSLGSWVLLQVHVPFSQLSLYYGIETLTFLSTLAFNSSFDGSFFHTIQWSFLSPFSSQWVKILASSWWWGESCIRFSIASGALQSRWLASDTALQIILYHSWCFLAPLQIAKYSEFSLGFVVCWARYSYPIPTWWSQYPVLVAYSYQ